MGRGAWWAAVHVVAELDTTEWLHSRHSLHTLSLEKEMATHSSILAWKSPWTEDPGGPWSMGSQRVRHNWSAWARMHYENIGYFYCCSQHKDTQFLKFKETVYCHSLTVIFELQLVIANHIDKTIEITRLRQIVDLLNQKNPGAINYSMCMLKRGSSDVLEWLRKPSSWYLIIFSGEETGLEGSIKHGDGDRW